MGLVGGACEQDYVLRLVNNNYYGAEAYVKKCSIRTIFYSSVAS